MAQHLINAYRISAHRACRVISLQRAGFAYKTRGRDDTIIRPRLRELTQVRVRYGSQRLYILLPREGWPDNHKRVHHLYCLEGLNLHSKHLMRDRATAHRLEWLPLGRLHQSRSIDFMADNLFDGRKIRALTIVDNFSRQYLAIHVGQSLQGEEVVAVMQRHTPATRLVPERIQVDNGSEFISKALNCWAYDQHVTLDFFRSGKLTYNAYIKSFNGSFRAKCWNVHWFL